jgi:hypothetical protein
MKMSLVCLFHLFQALNYMLSIKKNSSKIAIGIGATLTIIGGSALAGSASILDDINGAIGSVNQVWNQATTVFAQGSGLYQQVSNYTGGLSKNGALLGSLGIVDSRKLSTELLKQYSTPPGTATAPNDYGIKVGRIDAQVASETGSEAISTEGQTVSTQAKDAQAASVETAVKAANEVSNATSSLDALHPLGSSLAAISTQTANVAAQNTRLLNSVASQSKIGQQTNSELSKMNDDREQDRISQSNTISNSRIDRFSLPLTPNKKP